MRVKQGTTTAPPSLASRGSADRVAACTPKNGTKIESSGPLSMSGR